MAFQQPKPGDVRKLVIENVGLRQALNEISRLIARHHLEHTECGKIDIFPILEKHGVKYKTKDNIEWQ